MIRATRSLAVQKIPASTANTAVRLMGSKTELSYTEQQAAKGRPVSPHVTIYKFPVAALSSITNRVTGVALSVGVTGIGALALAGADVAGLASTIGNIGGIGFVAKFAVAFPLTFHYLGGIRHIMWDKNPETLQNEPVEKSSYALFGASVLASVAFAAVSL